MYQGQGLVFKFSYHHVNGNIFAFDLEQFEDDELNRSADVVNAGVHFAF